MNKSTRALLIAASALASVGVGAVTRGTIVEAPAVAVVEPTAAPAAVVVGNTSVIVIVPTPKPPLPPGACNRGNPGGVSRC